MGQFFDALPDHLIKWIKQQKMFWVASAPLTPDGHVNVSPKGFEGTFHIVNSHQVWYDDMSGSGIETISHLKENKRITVLFHAFEGPPRIVRLFGKGTVYEFGTPEYEKLLPAEVRQPGSRAVIMIDIFKVGSSCGFAIPFYTYRAPRMLLHRMNGDQEVIDIRAAEASEPPRPEGGLKEYWQKKNNRSLDGLPGLTVAFDSTTTFKQSGPYPKDDIRTANTKEPLLDTRAAFGIIIGILLSVAFVQLRTYVAPLLFHR